MEVCNPVAAKSVLESDSAVGFLLPCTIAVYQKNNKNYISLERPTLLLSITSNKKLESIGKYIETKLIQAIEKSK
ncbi:MAG: DUF302 domain-containing protein [Nitrosopumilaceae archaeon]